MKHYAAALCALSLIGGQQLKGQGCSPIHHMALSLSGEGIRSLEAGTWEASFSYRFLHSERVFIGGTERPDLQHPSGSRLDLSSFDVQVSYAWTRRLSTSLTVPFSHADASTVVGHTDGKRHTTAATGLGDVRVIQNLWLFDPVTHESGNISLGVGVKIPTGDDAVSGDFFTPGGVIQRPVDVAMQPGDGGWGAIVELQGFRRLGRDVFAYGSGVYVLNPREQNGVLSRTPIAPNGVNNSVPDQYTARLGLSWSVPVARGLSLSLGGRFDGMPTHDLIGGSLGFRRPGTVVYVDPGVYFTQGNYNIGVNLPVATYVYRSSSLAERQRGIAGAGGFADYVVTLTASIRF